MPRALVVEDDPAIQAALVHALRTLGHVTQAVDTAAAALRETASGKLDIVLLDLGLPDLDGVAALTMMRRISNVPILVATARGDEDSLVRSLNAGADDYIVKPFSSKHLAARINALLRRSASVPYEKLVEHDDVIRIGGLHIDPRSRRATLDGEVLSLRKREFDLLAYLAEHPSQVVGRRELFRMVWGHANLIDDRTIDVHASWLRRKLGETAAAPRYLHTVRGVGYRLSAPA